MLKIAVRGWLPRLGLENSLAVIGTAGLVRSHMLYVDTQGMLTIAGGKWTTYRAMAEEGINRAVKEFNLRYVLQRAC